MKPAITVKNLNKDFKNFTGRRTQVLSGIDLEISEGEFFVLLGPSGCGKSTLLRAMSGLDTEYTGKINFPEHLNASDIGFVFQQFALLPWLTVRENIGLGLIARKVSKHELHTVVQKELTAFGLDGLGDRYPRQLSGGQKQRVGLARGFATAPKLLFMDEPFSALDSFTAKELRAELLRVWEERRPTIVMVTHNIQEALELADRIAVMAAHPGRIEKIVTNPLPRPRPMRSESLFRLEDELYKLVKP